MKKTVKKGPSKASHKKPVKDLHVKPARGGTVRGGTKVVWSNYSKWIEL